MEVVRRHVRGSEVVNLVLYSYDELRRNDAKILRSRLKFWWTGRDRKEERAAIDKPKSPVDFRHSRQSSAVQICG